LFGTHYTISLKIIEIDSPFPQFVKQFLSELPLLLKLLLCPISPLPFLFSCLLSLLGRLPFLLSPLLSLLGALPFLFDRYTSNRVFSEHRWTTRHNYIHPVDEWVCSTSS
jgi:hypothetical protein